MLACARIGAPHTVVFGGFSADALRDRDRRTATRKVVITADGGYRRGAPAALKPAVDEALRGVPATSTHVLVVRRTGQDVDWNDDRDVWWHDAVGGSVDRAHAASPFDAEHPLYVMYTSGTTGKPKGILHTTGGYLTGTSYTHWAVFDLKPETDVFWCTRRHRLGDRPLLHRLRPAGQRRDLGDVRGHARTPRTRAAGGRSSQKYKRHDPLHRADRDPHLHEVGRARSPTSYDLSSLRLLGSVGEPINPEAYIWYREVIGGDRTPGRGHLVADRDRRDHDQPAARRHRRQAGLGDDAAARASRPTSSTTTASRCRTASGGYLVLTEPWPAMLRTIWGDDERYKETYWSRFASRATTSPATAPRRTRTATSGCSAASTTS